VNILVTGGAGYIGSHICLELLSTNLNVFVIDNLSSSSIKNIENIQKITSKEINFLNLDIRDKNKLNQFFSKHKIDAVMHLAGLRSCNKSIANPEDYYDVNVLGTINLLESMKKTSCRTLIFCSSASVYGSQNIFPISETVGLLPNSPYARSNLIIEEYLKDLRHSDKTWSIGILRCFNSAGAHKSGLLGENILNTQDSLISHLSRVVLGKYSKLDIYGDNCNTYDGTPVRDYVHVVDVAKAHINSLSLLIKKQRIFIINIGCGVGYSVLEMIKNFEKITKKKIHYEFLDRRTGDVECSFADLSFTKQLINWNPKFNIDDICKDTLESQKNKF